MRAQIVAKTKDFMRVQSLIMRFPSFSSIRSRRRRYLGKFR
jgi:hypothetical protein